MGEELRSIGRPVDGRRTLLGVGFPLCLLNSKTRQPRSAKSEAVAFPIPELPPVITIVFMITSPVHLRAARER